MTSKNKKIKENKKKKITRHETNKGIEKQKRR